VSRRVYPLNHQPATSGHYSCTAQHRQGSDHSLGSKRVLPPSDSQASVLLTHPVFLIPQASLPGKACRNPQLVFPESFLQAPARKRCVFQPEWEPVASGRHMQTGNNSLQLTNSFAKIALSPEDHRGLTAVH
jgi:hypothetical protein